MLGITSGWNIGSPPPKVLDVAGGTGDIAFRWDEPSINRVRIGLEIGVSLQTPIVSWNSSCTASFRILILFSLHFTAHLLQRSSAKQVAVGQPYAGVIK